MDPTTQTTPRPAGESPFGPPSLPRPSISYLMLWTACSGVYLALSRAIDTLLASPESSFLQASVVSDACVSGAVIAAVIVLARARYRATVPLAMHPGHWLLLAQAVTSLLNRLLGRPLTYFIESSSGMLFLFWSLVQVAPSIFYALAARYSAITGWRVWFAVRASLGLIWVVVFAAGWLQMFESVGLVLAFILTWGYLGVGVWIVLQPIIDVLHRRRFDWLHWAGVVTFLVGGILGLLLPTANWLMTF